MRRLSRSCSTSHRSSGRAGVFCIPQTGTTECHRRFSWAPPDRLEPYCFRICVILTAAARDLGFGGSAVPSPLWHLHVSLRMLSVAGRGYLAVLLGLWYEGLEDTDISRHAWLRMKVIHRGMLLNRRVRHSPSGHLRIQRLPLVGSDTASSPASTAWVSISSIAETLQLPPRATAGFVGETSIHRYN